MTEVSLVELHSDECHMVSLDYNELKEYVQYTLLK